MSELKRCRCGAEPISDVSAMYSGGEWVYIATVNCFGCGELVTGVAHGGLRRHARKAATDAAAADWNSRAPVEDDRG